MPIKFTLLASNRPKPAFQRKKEANCHMRIHFIAIGGSAMHNLALAMHDGGHEVSGSDDQILEPSKGRLHAAGILPSKDGWFPEQITEALDVIILGMHARPDNPELLRAQKLGLNVQSYPEFLFHATENQQRVVIGGSHGKTTVTSMLLHVLHGIGKKVNYMVGAQLEGFDRMVALNDQLDMAIFEGDEYLSSPIDRRPKFFWYKPHFAILTGIAWDHINVFPTEAEYDSQFAKFIDTLAPNATLIWCEEDEKLQKIVAERTRTDIRCIPYRTPSHQPMANGQMRVAFDEDHHIETHLVGSHNIQNLSGARKLASILGISEALFDAEIVGFSGAARRLESLHSTKDFQAFRDFAHAPSKLKATTSGVKASYPDWELTAFFELHTFSSLNKDFLPSYVDSLRDADHAVVYYDPAVLSHKNMPKLDPAFIRDCFGEVTDLEIITSFKTLEKRFDSVPRKNHVLLMMSSGWFSGLDCEFDGA